MKVLRNALISAGLALVALAASPMPGLLDVRSAEASEIKYIVNNVPITSYDIQRRAAFMKLQRAKGSASDQMIDQTLHLLEATRLKVRVTDEQVDEAYARFAKNNKMQIKQLDGVLTQTGVTTQHFKDFIRAQMAWNQAIGIKAKGGSGKGGRMTEQEAVRKMMEKGGAKPSATEYMLQQVIFVVPANERGTIGRRKGEAEAMRQRFNSCETTRQFAKGLIDVTVRDLGRVLAPELPAEWADFDQERTPGLGHRGQADRPRPGVHRHLQRPRSVGRPHGPDGAEQRAAGRRRPRCRPAEQTLYRGTPQASQHRRALGRSLHGRCSRADVRRSLGGGPRAGDRGLETSRRSGRAPFLPPVGP